MARATKLLSFVVIRWVVLTLSRRQAQPRPWVKVKERSSSTFHQTLIFFVPNIKGLAEKVLTWEGKVFAAADADVDAAETDWKHKVTPERGDLNRLPVCNQHTTSIHAGINYTPFQMTVILLCCNRHHSVALDHTVLCQQYCWFSARLW